MIKESDKVKYIGENMEAILKRDQRTTSHRVFDCCEKNDHCQNYNVTMSNDRRNKNDNHDNFEVSMTDKNNFNFYKCKNIRKIKRINNVTVRYFNPTILQRLVFSVILMMLVIPVRSAPNYNRALYENRMKRTQPWDNPCGSETIENVYLVDNTDRNMTEDFEGFARPVITMMSQSLEQGRSVSEIFVSEELRVAPQEAFDGWLSDSDAWLPTREHIPKILGKRVPVEILRTIEVRMLDDLFVDQFYYIQLYSMALEQIVWDYQDRRSHFAEKFDKLRTGALGILCELHMMVLSRGKTPRPSPTRNIMPIEVRVLDETYRHMRDWVVLREYVNCLEYFFEIFMYVIESVDE